MRNMKNNFVKIVLILILFFPLVISASNINKIGGNIINPAPNPSASYCEDLGYKFVIKDTPEGQIGICKISDLVEAYSSFQLFSKFLNSRIPKFLLQVLSS